MSDINEKGVVLIVNATRYRGWKSIRVTRSIESLAGSFALEANDRWKVDKLTGEDAVWPILEEDECRVEIDGIAVIDGWIDKRSISATKDSRTLSYTGRDRAGALVDCSAILDGWTSKKVDVAAFAAKIAAPFGVRVSVQPGLHLAPVSKVVISPGDTALEAIRTAAGDDVLFVSDGAGGIVITRSGTSRASSLVEGENILSASVDYDASDRYGTYVVTSQAAGADNVYGDDVLTLTGAGDGGVRRFHRVLIIQPDKGYGTADAQRRASWEAGIRAARAEAVTITVQGWQQPSGALWPINALTYVKAPRLVDVDGDMLISEVEYSISEGGRITQLRLVRPGAFTPEPKAVVMARRRSRTAKFDPSIASAAAAIDRLNSTIKRLKGKK
jgi:prophage tail gpP-like protein